MCGSFTFDGNAHTVPAATAGRAIGALPRLNRTAPVAPDRCLKRERPAGWRRSEARAYLARRGRELKRRNVPRPAAKEPLLSRCVRVNLSARILLRDAARRVPQRAGYLRRSRGSSLS